jgi:hypothetical protein
MSGEALNSSLLALHKVFFPYCDYKYRSIAYTCLVCTIKPFNTSSIEKERAISLALVAIHSNAL